MGILDNLENAWDDNFDSEPMLNWCHANTPQFESTPMAETDAMGREKFWQDLGRPEETSLAVKLFSETCCTNCSCSK
jgi:hypothetical protein